MHLSSRRRSTGFKIVNSRNTPYDKDMSFFNIFINNGRICMVFEADGEEWVKKLEKDFLKNV